MLQEKREEAAEAIQAVIAQYGCSPEFSGFRNQAGAAVSSLQKISPNALKKSMPALPALSIASVIEVLDSLACLSLEVTTTALEHRKTQKNTDFWVKKARKTRHFSQYENP